MKVAICSSDGIDVDLHFGKTSEFYIYNIHGGHKTFLEKRGLEKYSPTEEFLSGLSSDHEFDSNKFDAVYKALSDCKKIYTVSIGAVPSEKLKEQGMEIQLCSCPISSIPTCSGNCKS